MYKILLSGASSKSFIGRHLSKYLGELGYEVDTISKEEFNQEDWRRLDKFQLEEGKPDVVVHCAWIRDELDSMHHYEFAELSCEFFNQCKARGIRVINLGSSSEYGVKDEQMQEDMNCTPINKYGIAKLMVTLHAKLLGFNTLRLFAVTGEGGHSFWDMCSKSVKWEYPTSVRHVVPVKMVCKAVERLIHAQHMYGEIINVASHDYMNYDDMRTEQNVNGEWLRYPQRQYEPSRWEANTDKMTKLLNL